MSQLRLIPLVVIAALGLLTLKALELLASGSTTLDPKTAAVNQPVAQSRDLLKNWDVAALLERGVDPVTTGSSTPPAHDAPKDGKPTEAAQPTLTPSTVDIKVSETRPTEVKPTRGVDNSSETRILEKLGDRRKQIEDRERELEIREGLLKATEGKIEKRIDDLKIIEDKIGTGAKVREDTKVKELADLVKMYEAMKAKDAARVFDRLEATLLVDIAKQMNPKKLADVVSKMSPDIAQKLTVGLANRTAKDPNSTQGVDLPKIEGGDG